MNLDRGRFVSRRRVLAAFAGCVVPALVRQPPDDTSAALKALEARMGGRLGACILDTRTGSAIGHRLDERFAMCSTFKLPLAAAVLREADHGRLRLADAIPFSKKDMVPHAPVTGEHLHAGRMTMAALAEAAQVTSDNVAANLLLRRLGGPAAFTSILRALGDDTTRLDRYEPDMNLVLPGEARDTTTPRAMAATVSRFAIGDVLTPASRDVLVSWMIATRTGDKRLRAGFPRGWRAGDKTGTAMADAMTDKYNDVAVVWPPGRPALVVAAYFDTNVRSAGMSDAHQAVLADVGRLAAAWASRQETGQIGLAVAAALT